jgi:oligopeptidase B
MSVHLSEDTPTARVKHPSLVPPVARRDPHTTHLHGHTLHDDYGWMTLKDSPEVFEYLTAENAYTEAAMQGTKDFQAALYKEMLSHIKETDESVPYPDHGWLYYTRTVEGSQYPIHCRRAAADGSPEEIILDVNQLAIGQPYMAVGITAVSPNGMLLAYSTDNTGFRQYTLRVRNLRTGIDLADTEERVGSIAWAADSTTLFFTTEDEQTKRHNKLFRHTLGEFSILSPGGAHLLFEEQDERFNLGVGRTRDRKYLLVESGSHTTNEVRFLPAAQPLADLILIAPRLDDQEYYPDHRDGLFYIRTNDTTKNFRLVKTTVTAPGREHWREFYLGAPDVPLEDFDLFQAFFVLTERNAGLPTLAVHRLTPSGEASLSSSSAAGGSASPTSAFIAFPEPTYDAGSHTNREFQTTKFRYSYTSLVSPSSVYEYDVETQTSTLLKQQEIPGGFDTSNYASERLWIPAKDGVFIPISLVYRRDTFAQTDNREQRTENPLYVSAYGSYGYPYPIGFSAARLALLDRGVIVAYAHIRGGGDLGDAWHDAGKMHVKMNTFTDFISCVEGLLAQGYGDPERVAIEGGSAGGLLLGAVVNLAIAAGKPSLFRVVLSHVPFVDVMNTMLDASLPLTVAEYEEWGNPNIPEDFATMLAYSPYDNLQPANYPSMLVRTSLNDSQVMYWEPAKYVAKLRTLKRNDTPLLFHINMEAGHAGASGRYDYLKEIAFDYAFLLMELDRGFLLGV